MREQKSHDKIARSGLVCDLRFAKQHRHLFIFHIIMFYLCFCLLLLQSINLIHGRIITQERRQQLEESEENVTSPSSSAFEQAIMQQHRRRDDEVELIGNSHCKLTTSIETDFNGRQSGKGIMFTVRAMESLELLTIEFDANAEAEALPVEVYFLEGDFSGAAGDESRWTKVSDTEAVNSPNGKGAIIPAVDFNPVDMEAGGLYSIYLSFPEADIFKFKPTDGLIGEADWANTDNTIQVNNGVSFDDGPFPQGQFSEVAEFSGKLHYKTIQFCSNVATTTDVKLEFAIDGSPDAPVIQAISDAVEGAMAALLVLNPELVNFSKFFFLEVINVQSGFMGRSEDKCPESYESCALIHSTVTFSHLQSIESGTLQEEVLSEHEQVGEAVTTQVDFDIQYVGDPIISEDYLFKLTGVPENSPMNALQKRYFERVTKAFLDELADISLYRVEIVDEVTGGRMRKLSNYNNGSLRGSRNLQLDGTTQVAATVFGGGEGSELRQTILEVVGNDADRFIEELATQQLRPGEINEQNAGSYFARITGITASVKPSNFGQSEDDAPAESTEEGEEEDDNTLYIYICIGGMAFSFLWICTKLYFDFLYSPSLKQKKIDDPDYSDSYSDSPYSDSPKGRRPSMDGRRPSYDGGYGRGRRPSYDGSHDGARSLDGYSASAHDRRSLNRELPPFNSKSAHARLVPATGVKPERTGYEDDEPLGYENNNEPPRNRAGEAGRGIKPSKSLPTPLGRFFSSRNMKATPETTGAASATNGQDKAAPNEKAAQKPPGSGEGKPEPQRGLKPTKSMPTPLRNFFSDRKPKETPKTADASSTADPANAETGGKVTPQQGALACSAPKNSEADDGVTGKQKPKKAKQTKANGKKKKKKNVSSDGTVKSTDTKKSKGTVKSTDTKKKGKAKPKNKAGKKRGVTKSKSLPTPKELSSTKPKQLQNLEDWDSSSDESEATDIKSLATRPVKRQDSVDVETVESDSDSETGESIDQPSSAVSLFSSKKTNRQSPRDDTPTKEERPTPVKKMAAPPSKSKSMPIPAPHPFHDSANFDESSEESELDMGFDAESLSSDESNSDNSDHLQHRLNSKRNTYEPTGTTIDMDGFTPECESSESESSNESGESDLDSYQGEEEPQEVVQRPFQKYLPAKPTRYVSDDERSKESLPSQSSKPVKKHPPKKKIQDQLSSSNRSAPKHPPTKKGPMPAAKPVPVNRAGTNGRGIDASRSMPMDLSQHTQSSSGTNGVKKHLPVKKHAPVRTTSFEKHAPVRTNSFEKHAPVRTSSFEKHAPVRTRSFEKHAPVRTRSFDGSLRNTPIKKQPPIKKVSSHGDLANGTKAPVKKHAPKNMAGVNGRGIAASRSMDGMLSRKPNPVNHGASPKTNSSTHSRKPTKTNNQSGIPRSKSFDYGAAGKIVFKPRQKKLDEARTGTKKTDTSTAKSAPAAPVKKITVQKHG